MKGSVFKYPNSLPNYCMAKINLILSAISVELPTCDRQMSRHFRILSSAQMLLVG